MTPITDRAARKRGPVVFGNENTIRQDFVPVETARELEEMCEELVAELEYWRPTGEPLPMLGEVDKYVIAHQKRWHKSGDTLTRYQQLKEKAK